MTDNAKKVWYFIGRCIGAFVLVLLIGWLFVAFWNTGIVHLANDSGFHFHYISFSNVAVGSSFLGISSPCI